MRLSSSFAVFILQIVFIYSQHEQQENVNVTLISNDTSNKQLDSDLEAKNDLISLAKTTTTTTSTTTTQQPANNNNNDSISTSENENQTVPIQPYPVNDNKTVYLKFSRYLEDNPAAILITSPEYPKPYPANHNQTWSLDVDGGTGIEVTIHDLDINPLTDFLYFRGGTEDDVNEKGPKLTGHHLMPIKFKIIHTTKLFIWFFSDDNLEQENKGFALTYAPIGKINDTLINMNEIDLDSSNKMETYHIYATVPKIQQNFESWQSFKRILANSTNKYINKYELPVEMARSENISMVIKKCSSNWPDSVNCLDIQIAIFLRTKNNETGEFEENLDDYQLTTENLANMWDEFGKNEFSKFGIPEYTLPDTTFIILLWSGITVGITVLFLFVLYSIWRMEIFQEYRRMSQSHDDHRIILKNQADIDISMFPSPHQIVPTLFPNNNSEGYATSATQYEHDNMPSRKASFSTFDYSQKTMELNDLKGKSNKTFQDDEITFSPLAQSSRSKPRLQLKGSSKNSSST